MFLVPLAVDFLINLLIFFQQQYLKQCLEEDSVRTKKGNSTRDTTAEPSPNVSIFGKNHGK